MSQQHLARLDQIAASVKREYPAEHGLTAKNRRLVEHLDDPAFVDRLVTLPARLAEAATRTPDKRRAASLARDAVAVELLLTCTMRLANLVDLRLGESIRRFPSPAPGLPAIAAPRSDTGSIEAGWRSASHRSAV